MPSIVSPIPPQKAKSGLLFSYNIAQHFSIEPGATFTLKQARLDNGYSIPSWSTFNGTTLSGIPIGLDHERYYQFVAEVTYNGVSVNQVFTLVVYKDVSQNIALCAVLPKTAADCTYALTPSTINAFDWSTVSPGETVGLRGDSGNYNPFQIEELNQVANRTLLGASAGLGREVLITNVDGPITITNSSSYGIKGHDNNYLKILGQGTKEDPYGVKLLNGASGIGIQFQYNNYEGFEFAYIEIKNWDSIGISLKNELGLGNNLGTRNSNEALSDDMSRIWIHNCNLDTIGGEGLYEGTGFMTGRNYNNGLPHDDHFYFIGASAAARETSARAALNNEELFDSVNNRWLFEYEGNKAPGGQTYNWLQSQGYVENVDYVYVTATTLYPHMIRNNRVCYNIVKNCLWDGLQIKGASIDNKICDNYVYNTGTGGNGSHDEGIFIADGTTGEISGNYVEKARGTGLRIYITGETNVFNNIVVDCGDSLYGARTNPSGGSISLTGEVFNSLAAASGTPARTFRCFNNTFINCPGQAYSCFADIEHLIYRNNLYVNCGTGVSRSFAAGGSFTNANNQWLTTATALLEDIDNGDFRLKEGSPAIGAGYSSLGITTVDYYNRGLNTPVDLGAIAYESEPNSDKYSDWDYTPVVVGEQYQIKTEYRATDSDELNDVAHTLISNSVSSKFLALINETRKVGNYGVYRTTTPGSNYTLIATINALDEAYIDTTAVPGTTYHYVVRALKIEDQTKYINSELSNEDSGVVALPTGPEQIVKINFSNADSGLTDWHDMILSPSAGVQLTNDQNVLSGITAQGSSWSVSNSQGFVTGFPKVIEGYTIPVIVNQQYWSTPAVDASTRTLVFTIPAGKKIKMYIMSSRATTTGSRSTLFTIGSGGGIYAGAGVTQQIEAMGNDDTALIFDNITGNGSNQFTLTVVRETGVNTTSTGVMNWLIMEQYPV